MRNLKRLSEYTSLVFLCLSALILVGLQNKNLGWAIWCVGLITTLFTSKKFIKQVSLIYFSLSILGLTPINTSIDAKHFFIMGGALISALALPFLVNKYVYKDPIIKYRFKLGRKWLRKEIAYIFITAAISYFLFPFYLENTGAYLNWTVKPEAFSIFVLFIGTNSLGIWDELFFVNSVFATLKRHFPFWVANLAQAVLFTSFLYELGFTGWVPPLIYCFALTQGYIFSKTESLSYIITTHLTLDFFLFLALIHAHHPHWLRIFITG